VAHITGTGHGGTAQNSLLERHWTGLGWHSVSSGRMGATTGDRGETTSWTEDFDVVIRSLRLHARRFGQPDAPLTLALRGVSLNSRAFDYLGERLGDADVQLVALDLRGRGRSETTAPGTYGWENHALDLFAVADHLGFDRFSLIGQSMGGSVAMKAAELDGSRIDRIVLVDVAGRVDRGFGTLVGSLVAGARGPYRSPEEYVETIRVFGADLSLE
jgi:pimeloyl-ACP methyl ester carboxylesterase